jgi:Na+/melibiose symporter-like transporter
MLNLICSGAFIVLSVLMLFAAQSIPGSTEWDIVGSRMIPEMYLAGLLICSLVVFFGGLLQYLRSRGRHASLRELWSAHRTEAAIFAVLVLFSAAISVLGFYASVFAFLLFLQWLLNDRHVNAWMVSVSLCAPAMIYLLFEKGLNVLMPAGVVFS